MNNFAPSARWPGACKNPLRSGEKTPIGVKRHSVNQQVLNQADDRLRIPEMKRRAKRRRFLWVGLALLGAALLALYALRPRAPRPVYRTETVQRRTIVQRVEATGNLEVRGEVEVPAPAEGRLTSIAVAPRDPVQKGQLLATLDQRAAELAVRSAKATQEAASGRLAQARSALASAKRALDRARLLQSKGLASEQDVSQAQGAFDSAQAALAATQAERKVAEQNVASAKLGQSMSAIVAPVGGIVLRAPDRVGAAVSPARGPLFVIAEPLTTMRVEAPVSETDIASIKPGRKAEVIVQALPEKVFTATVDSIGIEPVRDSGVVAYPVRLLVDNPDGVLLPGMSARVRMEIARADDALAVREAALRFTPPDAAAAPSRSRVWRVQKPPNELEPVAVTPGISDGMYTAVQAAAGARLQVGDQVAIGLLRPGQASGKPSVSLGGQK